jgi:hypothetical protein
LTWTDRLLFAAIGVAPCRVIVAGIVVGISSRNRTSAP